MRKLSELLQEADWKSEKHVPVIDALDVVGKDEIVRAAISVGREVAHPSTTAHHIDWISLYFLPEGESFPYRIGSASFDSHGASTDGADTSGVYSHHEAVFAFRTRKPGSLLAVSHCNIHGLWQSSKEIRIR
ncbi:hypothetical protein JW921_00150 [Candidatus Fermentibacterales bacterium]|nr:hypothetical protein [Candidatus Fermentibacterales bacterium]